MRASAPSSVVNVLHPPTWVMAVCPVTRIAPQNVFNIVSEMCFFVAQLYVYGPMLYLGYYLKVFTGIHILRSSKFNTEARTNQDIVDKTINICVVSHDVVQYTLGWRSIYCCWFFQRDNRQYLLKTHELVQWELTTVLFCCTEWKPGRSPVYERDAFLSIDTPWP